MNYHINLMLSFTANIGTIIDEEKARKLLETLYSDQKGFSFFNLIVDRRIINGVEAITTICINICVSAPNAQSIQPFGRKLCQHAIKELNTLYYDSACTFTVTASNQINSTTIH